MGRAPCCDKGNVKRGPWSPEEDAKLKEYINKNGTGGNWIALPQKVGLRRCGKSCRLRWLNYLRPNIKHGEFSDEEDRIICRLYATIGSRWSVIAGELAGRTDNDIKNYWNTKLKKKLMAMSMIKPPRTSCNLPSSSSASSTGFAQTSTYINSLYPYQQQQHGYYNNNNNQPHPISFGSNFQHITTSTPHINPIDHGMFGSGEANSSSSSSCITNSSLWGYNFTNVPPTLAHHTTTEAAAAAAAAAAADGSYSSSDYGGGFTQDLGVEVEEDYYSSIQEINDLITPDNNLTFFMDT